MYGPCNQCREDCAIRAKRALITPLNLRHVTFQTGGKSVGVSEDVLGMYLGNANPRVESEDLETLLHFYRLHEQAMVLLHAGGDHV